MTDINTKKLKKVLNAILCGCPFVSRHMIIKVSGSLRTTGKSKYHAKLDKYYPLPSSTTRLYEADFVKKRQLIMDCGDKKTWIRSNGAYIIWILRLGNIKIIPNDYKKSLKNVNKFLDVSLWDIIHQFYLASLLIDKRKGVNNIPEKNKNWHWYKKTDLRRQAEDFTFDFTERRKYFRGFLRVKNELAKEILNTLAYLKGIKVLPKESIGYTRCSRCGKKIRIKKRLFCKKCKEEIINMVAGGQLPIEYLTIKRWR